MKLETIKLWQKVVQIRKNAFKNCLSLQKFDGSYIQYYHDSAFANCTNLREVNVDIDVIIEIAADAFFGCIFPLLKLTFSDDMEELLSQLPNRPLYWFSQGSTNSDVMDSMMKIVQFLSREDMSGSLMTMKTRIWGYYRKRVLFHVNEMCKKAKNSAQYVNINLVEEEECAINIMVAHYNMKEVVLFLTMTIEDVHNNSTIPAIPVQHNSGDTVAMGATANLEEEHVKKRRRKIDGNYKRPHATRVYMKTPSSHDCDVRSTIVRIILSYLIVEGPALNKVRFG